MGIKTRSWQKVAKGSGPDDCWEWLAAKNANGYGVFGLAEGRIRLAHRVAWWLEKGNWPDQHLLRRCDNPACVRPSHLFVGSQADNMADKLAKGRQPAGEEIPWSKLT